MCLSVCESNVCLRSQTRPWSSTSSAAWCLASCPRLWPTPPTSSRWLSALTHSCLDSNRFFYDFMFFSVPWDSKSAVIKSTRACFVLWISHFYQSCVFVSDQNAGTGQSAAGQYDVQLHQHLPDGGHEGAVESECSSLTLYHVSDKPNAFK